MPFGLARPLLGGNSPSLENIQKRTARWEKLKPSYGGDKTTPSLATEAVLNAVVLTQRKTSDAPRALSRMWSYQDEKGAFPWLSFNLAPWENESARYYGAALAAVAAGKSGPPPKAKKLRGFLKRNFPKQPLHNQVYALWAEAKMGGILSKAQKKALISALLEAQKDGAWSLARLGPWTVQASHPSNAKNDGYATGLIVYALLQAGLPRTDPSSRSPSTGSPKTKIPRGPGRRSTSTNAAADRARSASSCETPQPPLPCWR